MAASRIGRFIAFLLENAFLAIALVLTLVLSAITAMRAVLLSQEVVVPSLVERTVPEAGALAAQHRLLLRVEGKRFDARIPPESIVAQDPPPGAALKAHRSVRVWASLGPRRTVVPALQGESLRTGRLALEQAQLPIARTAFVWDQAPEGTIVNQNPPPGETDSLGAGIELLVSKGPHPADYVMPDLIGRPVDEAAETLRRAGLKLGDIRFRNYPGVAPGIVLRHLPPAGHRVNAETEIAVEVSKPS